MKQLVSSVEKASNVVEEGHPLTTKSKETQAHAIITSWKPKQQKSVPKKISFCYSPFVLSHFSSSSLSKLTIKFRNVQKRVAKGDMCSLTVCAFSLI